MSWQALPMQGGHVWSFGQVCHLTTLLAAQGLRDGEPDRLSRELRELIPSRRPKLPQHPQIILKQQPDSSGSMPAVVHDVGVSHTAAYDFEQA